MAISKTGNGLIAFFLSLNKYVNEDIAELLGDNWKISDEANTLVILDGLDEIEAKNKNDAIRRIELFSEQHPLSRIVISSRKNFYNQEKAAESGTLNGFSSYILLDLDYQEVRTYIEKTLGRKTEAFYDAISIGSLGGLLKVPFYLVSLVKLFKENNDKLPGTRGDVFEYLLNDRLRLDSTHYRTTVAIDRNKRRIHNALQRLSLAMNLLGRNYISEEEFVEIIPEDETRNLIMYCTAWKRNDGEIITWQFEHNNFQEYLAAKALFKKPLGVIKKCVSFKPSYNKIIPFWTNTISFLINMPDSGTLLDWLIKIQPELMVKVEPTRLENKVRLGIFKRIFNEFKEKKIWIPRNTYDFKELARFAYLEETADFLIGEIRKGLYYTTCVNAIELLGIMNIPTKRNEVKAVLMEVLHTGDQQSTEKSAMEQVKTEALFALAKLNFIDKESIDHLVATFGSSQSELIHSGLYYLIRKSNYLNEFIDFFLSGIQSAEIDLQSDDEAHHIGLSSERWNLVAGLGDARSKESILKILNYLIRTNDNRPHYSILDKALIKIVNNAALFADDRDVFELALKLFTELVNRHEIDDVKTFIHFFDMSNTRIKAFSEVLANKTANYINTLTALADEECLTIIAQQYLEGVVSEKDIWQFQNLLTLNNPALFKPFNELINQKSGNKFVLLPQKNFEKDRRARNSSDTNLLFNRDKFLDKIKEIYAKTNKSKLTHDETLKLYTARWDDESFSDLVFYTLLRTLKKEPLSFDEIANTIKKWDWSLFCVNELYRSFDDGYERELTKQQKEWIANWCYKNLEKVNFKQALKVKDTTARSFTTSYLAIYLWFFLRKLNLSYPDNVLLDLLSFDWLEKEMVGIQYLEDRLDKNEVRKRILMNLSEGIKIDDVLENHLDYCFRYKIAEAIPFATSTLLDSNMRTDTRDVALKYLQSLDLFSDLEQLVLQVDDEYKWTIIDALKGKTGKMKIILKELFDRGQEEDKIKATIEILKNNDISGLPYYVEWVKSHKSVPETRLDRLQNKSTLESLTAIDAIPYLIDLLVTSYDDAFKNDFPSLHDSILRGLTAIALVSEENYFAVRKELQNFIKTYSTSIKNVNFLNAFIDDLERSHYIQKGTKPNLSEIVSFLNEL